MPPIKKEWVRIAVYVSPEERKLIEEAQAFQQRAKLSDFCRVTLVEHSREVVAKKRAIDTQLAGGIPPGMADFLRSVTVEAFKTDSKGKTKGKA